MKNILVANYSLKTVGGSETFTYTLIEELKKRLLERGLNVEVQRIKPFKPEELKSSKVREKIFAKK